jgi:uncharacterized protein (TIGR02265 family)
MNTDSLPEAKTGTARFHLAYPRNLMPAVLGRSYTTAFKAALEAAGGREVSAELAQWEPERAQFTVTWH